MDGLTVRAMAVRDTLGRFVRQPSNRLSTAYRKRIEGATGRGLSLAEARGHSVRPAAARESHRFFGKPHYEDALHVLNRMRHGESLAAASRAEGIAPDTVRRYVGSALERDAHGQFRAKDTDRLYRALYMVDERGRFTVEPADSREASKLARYNSAVHRYLTTGDDTQVRRFERLRLRTRDRQSLRFVTDPATIERLAAAGEFEYSSLYKLSV
jgi:hypothetical protein